MGSSWEETLVMKVSFDFRYVDEEMKALCYVGRKANSYCDGFPKGSDCISVKHLP